MAKLDYELYQQVCTVLFDEWDPIGVNRFAPRDEYNAYAGELIGLIRNGATENEVVLRLRQFAQDRMGLSHIDEERDRRVARRLTLLVR